MKKFHKQRKRLIDNNEAKGSESLLSIYRSKNPFQNFHVSQAITLSQDDEEIFEILEKNE